MLRRNAFTLLLPVPLLAGCAEPATPPVPVAQLDMRPHIAANQQTKLVDLARCHSQAQDRTAAGPENPAFNAQVDFCMRGMGYSRGEVAEQAPPTRRPRGPS